MRKNERDKRAKSYNFFEKLTKESRRESEREERVRETERERNGERGSERERGKKINKWIQNSAHKYYIQIIKYSDRRFLNKKSG